MDYERQVDANDSSLRQKLSKLKQFKLEMVSFIKKTIQSEDAYESYEGGNDKLDEVRASTV